MDKAKSLNERVELPPCRRLDDFIFERSRFQLPNFTDFEKWGNRVVNNLIYYQTNYLYMSIVIMLIVGLMHPLKMFLGLLVTLIICSIPVVMRTENEIMSLLKRYPLCNITFVVTSIGFIMYNISSLLVLLFSVLLSFCVTFVHASLRLRDLKNKLANKIEGIGLRSTPMGILLKYIEDVTGIGLRAQTTFMQSHH